MSYWVWAGWIILLIVTFGVMEGWALKTGKPSLSATIWTWQKNFPLFGPLLGLLFGGLLVHFFWMGAPGLNCPH